MMWLERLTMHRLMLVNLGMVVSECMKRTRAVFKLAVKYCKNNVEQVKADACAEGRKDKDANKFWRSVYMLSNNKATNLATCVGGCSDAVM